MLLGPRSRPQDKLLLARINQPMWSLERPANWTISLHPPRLDPMVPSYPFSTGNRPTGLGHYSWWTMGTGIRAAWLEGGVWPSALVWWARRAPRSAIFPINR